MVPKKLWGSAIVELEVQDNARGGDAEYMVRLALQRCSCTSSDLVQLASMVISKKIYVGNNDDDG
jgi:hypothetical protein